jgi:hypothetical protein
MQVAIFCREGLSEPFAIQAGAPRHFLVPLSEYSPPLY